MNEKRQRIYFAGLAMQLQMSNVSKTRCPKDRLGDVDAWRKEVMKKAARYSVMMADAMVEALRAT